MRGDGQRAARHRAVHAADGRRGGGARAPGSGIGAHRARRRRFTRRTRAAHRHRTAPGHPGLDHSLHRGSGSGDGLLDRRAGVARAELFIPRFPTAAGEAARLPRVLRGRHPQRLLRRFGVSRPPGAGGRHRHRPVLGRAARARARGRPQGRVVDTHQGGGRKTARRLGCVPLHVGPAGAAGAAHDGPRGAARRYRHRPPAGGGGAAGERGAVPWTLREHRRGGLPEHSRRPAAVGQSRLRNDAGLRQRRGTVRAAKRCNALLEPG